MEHLVKEIRTNWKKIWYVSCFLLLGIIDQRRGSATGEIQMIFSNVTGIVMVFLAIPSLDMKNIIHKVYSYWTPICIILTILSCYWGYNYWTYKGQWISGTLCVSLWSYLIIYIAREWKTLEIRLRLRQPYFWCIALFFMLMLISAYGGIRSLWFLLIYGGFYCIGIPEKNTDTFFEALLDGIILWFFIQQSVAFGLRPYDYIRYKGLYAGETQNGLFYLISYCAFLLKCILLKEKEDNGIRVHLLFFLSAGSISFMLFTGGRAPVFATILITVIVYVWDDLIRNKSFIKLVKHGLALLCCIIISYPLVYGCIRYLPTVLHHPIWYEGDYRGDESVCSFDDWNSDKYISFEEATDSNIGRIVDALGIDYEGIKNKIKDLFEGQIVNAAEIASIASEPGSTPDNPYMIEHVNQDSAMGARIVIYSYYVKHLNFWGHDKSQAGFYYSKDIFFEHTHNMFLQMAYDYGILAGLLYLGIYIYSLYKVFQLRRPSNLICAVILLAIAAFGMVERATVPGQITVSLSWILFYFIGRDSKCIV